MSTLADIGDRLASVEAVVAVSGEPVWRHEIVLPGALDPVSVAAALRGGRRTMLLRAERDPVARVVLAVGELAVVSTGVRADSAGGIATPTILQQAIAFLDDLQLRDAVLPEERRWFGVLGFDAIRDFERLGPEKDQDLPVYDFFLPEAIVSFEPESVRVVGRGTTPPTAARVCDHVVEAIVGSRPAVFAEPSTSPGVFTFGAADYADAVTAAKQHIVDGDVFQVVLSVGVTAESDADGLAVYRELSRFNPSPYQFWYSAGAFEVAGCSPEPCVELADGLALVRPLAGTRPRGARRQDDLRAERDLLGSHKELAEHRMLVDLARNDLGRVCDPGTVTVPRLLGVERFSHVMHLTSEVTGRLAADRTVADLIQATFPAGTMTGAPKLRAIEVIDELEPRGRGLYSGAVGSFGPEGVDLVLVIRSVVLTGGRIRIQAGGGIVYDSDAKHERDECFAKLAAPARAVRLDLGGKLR
ncbi:anthranilate synthase component 1 [Catenulispora sp. EB89]|uniref:anthranilate synthase component I family protein n=1 Tax=Catenulispora sp. EB89 TaxID=3156257 RepID=UPI0035168584